MSLSWVRRLNSSFSSERMGLTYITDSDDDELFDSVNNRALITPLLDTFLREVN
jgi:hypothetical protein